MTRQEQIPLLQAKGDALIKWFEGRELPKPPFKMSACETVHNPQLLINTNVTRMNATRENPFHKVYVAGYYMLFNLKTFIENEPGATNIKPATKRKAGKPGNKGTGIPLAP